MLDAVKSGLGVLRGRQNGHRGSPRSTEWISGFSAVDRMDIGGLRGRQNGYRGSPRDSPLQSSKVLVMMVRGGLSGGSSGMHTMRTVYRANCGPPAICPHEGKPIAGAGLRKERVGARGSSSASQRGKAILFLWRPPMGHAYRGAI